MAARLGIMLLLLEDTNKHDHLKRRRRGRQIRSRAISRDIDFIRKYRLSEELVSALELDLAPYLPAVMRSSGITKRRQILYALSYLATASLQKPAGKNVNTDASQSSVSKALQVVVDALNHPDVVKKYIRFPQGVFEREDLERKFYEKFHIPGVLGCINGALVTMVQPREHEERYCCRMGYYARKVLLITDADSNILHVDVSFGGATPDGAVFTNSVIKQHLDRLCGTRETVHLIGDSRYTQSQYLMTPFDDPDLDSPEAHYNKLHSNALKSAETTLDMLKGRFRCLLLQNVLQYDPTMVAKIVVACCVLHNMCNQAGLTAPKLEHYALKEEKRIMQLLKLSSRDGLERDSISGNRSREQLMNQLWTQLHS